MRPIDYFDTAVEAGRNRIALVDGRVELSFGEVQRLTHAIARALTALADPGCARAVAILSRNDHRVVACTLGIMRAGHAVVPVHARNSVDEIVDFLSETGPICVFYHSSCRQQALQVQRLLGKDTPWVCLDAPDGPNPSLDMLIGDGSGSGEAPDWGEIRDESDRPVYLRQTSGTTGRAKLVVDDIKSFNASQLVLRQVLRRENCNPVFLAAAPLSHACGVFAFSMLSLGATIVVLPHFEAAQIFAEVERRRVTHMWMPPAGLYLLLDAPGMKATDWSSLRLIVLGAAAAAPDRLREAVTILGPKIALNYSQIESGFLTWLDEQTIAAAVAGSHEERLTSSGTSLFVGRLGIMDDDGHLLPQGERGEIVVRGPSVKDYGDPEQTAKARRFGWHHTGDLGYLDESGYLFVVGRRKDIIISGGFKISASQVESVIMELPQVSECAVVAVPDDFRGEAAFAVVSIRPGHSLASPAITAHCRKRLGAERSPRGVQKWKELPKTAVGKVDKREIRDRVCAALNRKAL